MIDNYGLRSADRPQFTAPPREINGTNPVFPTKRLTFTTIQALSTIPCVPLCGTFKLKIKVFKVCVQPEGKNRALPELAHAATTVILLGF